ncbi:hypothetical protein NDN08_008081 [Rhodosorus marinus]|uniref:Uncharacterized protein n=1 Tax=Rhodosorus marinus TaxID=101924 RepID=A0AAV8UZC7_9RHOD|nr:hypothetical protein NDN08_008081 [Rhodosorus marinus]
MKLILTNTALLLAAVLLVFTDFGAAVAWRDWRKNADIPTWVIPGFCYGSDRLRNRVFRVDQNLACTENAIEIAVEGGVATPFDGIKNCLFQVAQVYTTCAVGGEKKVRAVIRQIYYIPQSTKELLNRMVAFMNGNESQIYCFEAKFRVGGFLQAPVVWKFSTSRGIRGASSGMIDAKIDYFVDRSVPLRLPREANAATVAFMKEAVMGYTVDEKVNTSVRTVLYVPTSFLYKDTELLSKLRKTAEEEKANFKVYNGPNDVSLCEELSQANIVVLPDWQQGVVSFCMKTNAHLITSVGISDEETFEWYYLNILSLMLVRVYKYERMYTGELGKFGVNFNLVSERLAKNLKDEVWQEDPEQFFQNPHL